MPSRLKHPCAHPLCPELVEPGERFCLRHKADNRAYDRDRGTANDRGYDVNWQKVRLAYLRAHPLAECDRCGRLGLAGRCGGYLLPGEDVHHIDGNPQNNEWSNLLSLGHRCHSRLTRIRGVSNL